MNKLLVPVIAFLVSACQAPPFSPDSPLSPVPEQSTLILHQSLNIPPNTVSLWFQKGRQMPPNDLDRYYPHCKFETLEIQNHEKTINPDSFVIYKVLRWDDYATHSVKLASARLSLGIGLGGDDPGPGHLNTTTEMFLRSEQQPDVYRLVCSQWEDPADRDHVTINQIRQALGTAFSLKLPARQETDGNTGN